MLRPSNNLDRSRKESQLTEKVHKWLVDAITENRLAPGQQLRESALARNLGVSRTPVREALKLLVNEGLATYNPSGIVVTELTVKDVQDLYETTQVLRSLASRLAATRATQEQMDRLEEIAVEMETAAAYNDRSRWKAAHKLLHEHIVLMARNRVLTKMERSIAALIQRIRYLSINQPGRLEQSTKEHRYLVEAIKARDDKLAGRIMFENLKTVERMLVSILDNYVVPFKGERF